MAYLSRSRVRVPYFIVVSRLTLCSRLARSVALTGAASATRPGIRKIAGRSVSETAVVYSDDYTGRPSWLILSRTRISSYRLRESRSLLHDERNERTRGLWATEWSGGPLSATLSSEPSERHRRRPSPKDGWSAEIGARYAPPAHR